MATSCESESDRFSTSAHVLNMIVQLKEKRRPQDFESMSLVFCGARVGIHSQTSGDVEDMRLMCQLVAL